MLDMDQAWYKHSYVCTDCDGLYEITIKSNKSPNPECTEDGQFLTLMSVVDATIHPITEQKEEKMETIYTIAETYNPNLLVTYKKIEDGEVSYPTDKVVDIEYALDQSRRNYKNLTDQQNAWFKKESQLRTLLDECYADSDDQQTLAQIAEIFDVPLTKEIEVTAYIRISATIEVDMADGDYDLEDLVRNQITIDAYGSELNISDYEVERVEEGNY
jgi:hypothetical protein